MKSKLKELTSRSNGCRYAKRKQKLKEYIRGGGYSPIMHLAASSVETAPGRLSNADGVIFRMAPKIGTAVCGTACTVV